MDIVNGNLKLILGLIWSLIVHYQIGRSKFPPKKLMLAWLKVRSRLRRLTTSISVDFCFRCFCPCHWLRQVLVSPFFFLLLLKNDCVEASSFAYINKAFLSRLFCPKRVSTISPPIGIPASDWPPFWTTAVPDFSPIGGSSIPKIGKSTQPCGVCSSCLSQPPVWSLSYFDCSC